MLTTDELVDQALKLPEKERSRLVEALLESLPDYSDEDEFELPHHDPAFRAELLRRSQEIEDDPTCTVSWEEVLKEARLELDSPEDGRCP